MLGLCIRMRNCIADLASELANVAISRSWKRIFAETHSVESRRINLILNYSLVAYC